MDKRIEKQIQKIYEEVYKKVYNNKTINSIIRKNKKTTEQTVLSLEKSEQFKKFAEKFAKKLAKEGINRRKGLWRKYYEAAKARHFVGLPDTYKKFELQILEKIVRHNFEMIKSIPKYVLEVEGHKYAETLVQQVAQGKLSRGQFERELRSHGWKNAKVIARTETAKLQTAITETESKDLGSVAYIWKSSHDKRTRPSHRAMNDVVVFWRKDNEKPLLDEMRGNAGEFPNCRCDAQAIFDETDLTKSVYDVYDYRHDKVIKMSKRKLLEAIQQGEL